MGRALLSRVRRLEDSGNSRGRKIHFVFVQNGETSRQALGRYRSENLQATDGDIYFIMNLKGTRRP